MVTIESEDILTNFIRRQTKNPQPKHIRIQDGRETYLSQGNFGLSQGSGRLPKVAGFNFAFPGLANGNGHLFAIQSHRFRTPEVILGCPWSYSVDVWNLGLLVSWHVPSPQGGTDICICGTSWKVLVCLTGRLVKMASTTRMFTWPKWYPF